jgi:hypothetical protein
MKVSYQQGCLERRQAPVKIFFSPTAATFSQIGKPDSHLQSDLGLV